MRVFEAKIDTQIGFFDPNRAFFVLKPVKQPKLVLGVVGNPIAKVHHFDVQTLRHVDEDASSRFTDRGATSQDVKFGKGWLRSTQMADCSPIAADFHGRNAHEKSPLTLGTPTQRGPLKEPYPTFRPRLGYKFAVKLNSLLDFKRSERSAEARRIPIQPAEESYDLRSD